MRDQEIIGLWEAYQQVHAQPQEKVELDEGRTTSLQALSRESAKRKADKERGRPETESEVHGRLMMGNFRPGASQEERAKGGRQRLRDRGKVPQKDGKDMFEHILEYLVAEGYADTNKAALAIMTNMSEDWKQSIIEAVGIVGPPKKAIDAIPGVRALRIGLSNAAKASDYPASYSSQDIPMAGKHVIPTERFPSQSTFAKTRPSGKGPVGYKDISGD